MRSAQNKASSGTAALSAIAEKLSSISLGGLAGKLGAIAIAVVVICLVGLIGFVGVSASGAFAVSEVEFVATKHVDAASMERMVKFEDSANLLNISKEEILEQLKSNPWIRDVSIERHFPHSLVITPVEREVYAIAYVTTTNIAWAIGDDDCWIAPVSLSTVVEEDQSASSDDAGDDAAQDAPDASSDTSDEAQTDGAATDDTQTTDAPAADDAPADDASVDDAPADDAPLNLDGLEGYEAALAVARDMGAILITDCGADIDPQPGKPVENGGVSNALQYAHDFSASFMENVRSFSAMSAESTSAYLESGVEVALGKADKISFKERATLAVLEKDSSVVYINVRIPESPTWRSVPL